MQNPGKLHKVLFRCKMAVGFQICLRIFGRMTSWEVILILVSRGKKNLPPIFFISFAHNRSLRSFFKKNSGPLPPLPSPQISFYGNSITTGRISKISSDLSFLSLTTSQKDLVYFSWVLHTPCGQHNINDDIFYSCSADTVSEQEVVNDLHYLNNLVDIDVDNLSVTKLRFLWRE